jgi:hypothetical protein
MAYVKEQWWYEDSDGRRIGWMWPEDFEVILDSIYSAPRWNHAFADDFGYARTTVDRWRDGTNPIPKSVAQIVNILNRTQKHEKGETKVLHKLPIEADWLPDIVGANARKGPLPYTKRLQPNKVSEKPP